MTDYRLEGSEFERLRKENERLKAVIDGVAFLIEAYKLPHTGAPRLAIYLASQEFAFARNEKQKGILEALRQLYEASSFAGDEDAANTDAAREGGETAC